MKYISHGKKPLKVSKIPANAPQPYTLWCHPKSDDIVMVLGTGHHTETGEPVVLYVKNNNKSNKFWARPLSMWSDKITNGYCRFFPLYPEKRK